MHISFEFVKEDWEHYYNVFFHLNPVHKIHIGTYGDTGFVEANLNASFFDEEKIELIFGEPFLTELRSHCKYLAD